MATSKADIIARLQRDILPLQGLKSQLKNNAVDSKMAPIKNAFPNNAFPIGAIHEFISQRAEDAAATGGFISALVAALMNNKGISIWISSSRNIFPPALQSFGIEPSSVIFIDLKKEKEIAWVMEEALKHEGISAVIAEMQDLSFTASRRLQLAVEKSRVTGFIHRRNPKSLTANTCVSRWKISSLPSVTEYGLPGVGFPAWNVELQKIRNGRPGVWQVELVAGHFRLLGKSAAVVLHPQKKAGVA
ncbi:MAG: Error-prone repair protein ImuA [Rhizobacter sp.]|nr:Error-prone repair protein ImuA [Ferruginibacter sp.]